MPEIHSTGRGGAGNIGKDDTIYTDGAIVREGVEGTATSAGRGGAGNIADAAEGTKTAVFGAAGPAGAAGAVGHASTAVSDDYVPETAFRAGTDTDYHVGRGGQGNVHHKGDTADHHSGGGIAEAAEKVKHKVEHLLHLDKDK